MSSDNLDPIAVKKILHNMIHQTLFDELMDHLKVCDSSHYGGQGLEDLSFIRKKTIQILENLDRQIK